MNVRALAAAAAALSLSSASFAGFVKHEDLPSFLAAVSSPFHEDFDGFASGTALSSLPSVNISNIIGIDRSGAQVDTIVTSQDSLPFPMLAGLPTSSPPNLFSNDLDSPFFGTGTIEFDFASSMNAIGFFVADGSPLDTFRIQLFDGDTLIATINSDAPKTLPESFLGVTGDMSFDRAIIGSNSETDSWGIDDLYTQAIPGPGALSLVLVAGMGRRRRRGA